MFGCFTDKADLRLHFESARLDLNARIRIGLRANLEQIDFASTTYHDSANESCGLNQGGTPACRPRAPTIAYRINPR